MKQEEFDIILKDRIKKVKKVLGAKAGEYAIGGDRLYNFKRAAEIGRTTPAKALLGMMMKHVVSVIDLIEDPDTVTKERIDEKIGDTMNYLILLETILLEDINGD